MSKGQLVGKTVGISVLAGQCSFERYADDIVVHCSSTEEAEQML